MKTNIVKDKSLEFALHIINLYKYLSETKKEFILSKQLLRSGTSIGANVRESEQAQSKQDFIHKLSISLKEANETDYWIELLYKANYIDEVEYISVKEDVIELLKLLISIINTTKKTL